MDWIKTGGSSDTRPISRKAKRDRWERIGFSAVSIFFLLYLGVPILTTVLFSLSGKWTDTILPQSWSLNAYSIIFASDEFYSSLFRTIFLCLVVAVLEVAVTIPAVFAIKIGNEGLGRMIQILSIIPIALPAVVLALGSVKFYGATVPALLGTPALLIGVQAAFGLPFVYWTILNAFQAVDVVELYNAARTLRCGTLEFIIRIMIPSLKKGIIIAGVIAFASTFDNFALQQLIVGAGWETFAMYQYKYFTMDGHVVSTLSVIGMLIIFIMSWIAGFQSKAKGERKEEDAL